MDSFPHHHQHQHQQQDRRILGPPMAGVGGDHHRHHHQWYPSSSPQPPPPPASGYYNHLPPPQPQQQFYHHYPPPHHNQFPPPPRPISMPHHHPLPPMPLSAYPPPPPPSNQAWGNPSWAQHQGWEHPVHLTERNIPYNNEEDWAARAKAWASEKTGTENYHTQSHFTSVSRVDEHNYTYHDQYQPALDPTRDVLQPSFPQSSNQQLPVGPIDSPKQVNHLHGSASFSFGSSSYGTGYNSGVETTRTNADHMASPRKNYHPSLSIYEPEVSYNYSSAPGNQKTVHQSEGSHAPLPLPVSSVPERQHSHSTLPVQMISAEQPHFSHHGQPTNFLPDACDQHLDFQGRHDSDCDSYQQINYRCAGPAGAVGIVDHDPAASPVPAWTPTASGAGFPQIPLGPAGTQFDPTFIPQASLPVQPSPAFGGIPASSFQPIVPSVSVPYGVGPGASLHSAFNGDPNGALNLSERPKKVAVPNWLREEIIKKKPVIPSAVSTQPTGNSYSFGSEHDDKSLRIADQGDSKSMDSTRSTEDDDDDDEEDVEAARSAAINQEIKRVLTEVLLKVTDELFDEIATKVLNEDEQSTAEESTIDGDQKVSPPTANPTPKAATKVLVPARVETTKVDVVGEDSSTSSPGGNILGLTNYDSDDDDDIQSSKLSSGNEASASHQHESNDKPTENDYACVKDEANINWVAQRLGAGGSPLVDNLQYPDKDSVGVSIICEEPASLDGRKVEEVPSDAVISSQSNYTVGAKDDKGQESISGHAKSDKSHAKDYRDMELKRDVSPNKNPQNRGDNKASVEKTSRKTSDASDSIIHEDKLREKMEKREKFKERARDKSSEQGFKLKESDSRRSSMDSIKDDRKVTTKDKRDKYREDSERKRERIGDEKEDRTTRARKDSSRYNSRRSPSPSSRGRSSHTTVVCHHLQSPGKDNIRGLHVPSIPIADILPIPLARGGRDQGLSHPSIEGQVRINAAEKWLRIFY